MEEKKKILSKFNIKDYRNDMEVVLENKQFDEEAKSLILGVFYKIDNFYKDYITVKKDVEEKNKFLEDFINIIKNKCKKIVLLNPQQVTNENKFFVDRKKGEIRCLPNEMIITYAIFELIEKNSLLEDFTKICVLYVLGKGKTINYTEPIRDFNGWSWSMQIEKQENVVYNLIYQNLIILFGYKFIHDSIGKSNFIDLLKNRNQKEKYGEYGYKFINCLLENSVILYNNVSQENHDKTLKYKKSLLVRKSMLKNRKEYLDDTNKDSTDISRKIQEIDKMLGDISLIRSEYQKSIKENKKSYFCISDFVENKEKEKKNLLKKIKVNNKVLKEKQYLTNHDNYEDSLNLYELINNEEKVEYKEKINELQKQFLSCFKLKISKTTGKKEMYNLVLQLRYYCNLFYNKNKMILQNNNISKDLQDVIKLLIKKLIDNKIIDIGFTSEKLNYEILKYLFKTKIIELENINIKIKFIKNKEIEVEYYDAKILENTEKFEIPFEEEITTKKNRKIKLLKIGG